MTDGEQWAHRPVLPGESIDGGLYLHGVHVMQTTENVVAPHGSDAAPVVRLWVPADEFMAVQKSRDDYRIACTRINAQEVTDRDWRVVRAVLERVGMTLRDGRASASIEAWARRLPAPSTSGDKPVDTPH